MSQAMNKMEGFQLPQGFRCAGVTAGLKKSGLSDLALIVTDQPAVAAGVYTQNVIRAASIDWNRSITPTNQFRGLVVNSGNANACTGAQGIADNQAMAAELAKHIGAFDSQICVLSTGVIGRLMPMPTVLAGIQSAVSCLGRESVHFDAASRAIMTTDKFCKTSHSTIVLGGSEMRIAAMAKGAGMIGPNMATMLSVMLTDALLRPDAARDLLQRVADRSFNCISVEGHTSTNDALILVASGASRDRHQPLNGSDLDQFEAELTRLAIELATQIPSDGEGATHLISIEVTGASNHADADRIARSIANSALVKTAILGGDPNWGRIVSAAGYCGVQFDPVEVSLRINGIELFRAGTPIPFEAKQVSEAIQNKFETQIQLWVGTGSGSAQHWTSDLTVDYVRFNSEYTT
jgi:glutamate N-acetyltransferase / amino-acid N-acetyltransferase